MEDKYRGICFNPFREVCGNAASYCNPFDPQDITESIYKVISDITFRVGMSIMEIILSN